VGKFNVENALAAAAAVLALGTRFSDLLTSLTRIAPVPGRMELFSAKGLPTVVVDYAHTPDALEHALKAARSHTNNALWCVFGCGGQRDKGKRPQMGQVAAEFADQLVLTADNSRNESIHSIIADIKSGITKDVSVLSIEERQSAIRHALNQANSNDIILLAGKGHESYQEIEGHRVNYDERAFVANLIKELTE
jgi:UDP-N-acetylmuramoyl-L-alanyl-D-glutamate--2,6-diaminopimelate ligase